MRAASKSLGCYTPHPTMNSWVFPVGAIKIWSLKVLGKQILTAPLRIHMNVTPLPLDPVRCRGATNSSSYLHQRTLLASLWNFKRKCQGILRKNNRLPKNTKDLAQGLRVRWLWYVDIPAEASGLQPLRQGGIVNWKALRDAGDSTLKAGILVRCWTTKMIAWVATGTISATINNMKAQPSPAVQKPGQGDDELLAHGQACLQQNWWKTWTIKNDIFNPAMTQYASTVLRCSNEGKNGVKQVLWFS